MATKKNWARGEKALKAVEIVKGAGKDVEPGEIVKQIMKGCDMGLQGARTYYYNAKKGLFKTVENAGKKRHTAGKAAAAKKGTKKVAAKKATTEQAKRDELNAKRRERHAAKRAAEQAADAGAPDFAQD